MDQPTLQDKITGTIRNVQQNAQQLVSFAGEIAATTGLPRHVAHDILERVYQSAEQRQQQQSFGLTSDAAWQPQATSYSGSNR